MNSGSFVPSLSQQYMAGDPRRISPQPIPVWEIEAWEISQAGEHLVKKEVSNIRSAKLREALANAEKGK